MTFFSKVRGGLRSVVQSTVGMVNAKSSPPRAVYLRFFRFVEDTNEPFLERGWPAFICTPLIALELRHNSFSIARRCYGTGVRVDWIPRRYEAGGEMFRHSWTNVVWKPMQNPLRARIGDLNVC